MLALQLCSLLVFGQLLLQVGPSTGSKILGYLITPSRSHFIIHDSLLRGLAAKGHEVTVVSYFPGPKEPVPNYRYIQLEKSPESNALWLEMTSNLLDSAEKDEIFFKRFPRMIHIIGKLNTETYTSPEVERLKREEQFDLVIFGWFFNDYQIGLAAHFNCPAVISSSTPPFKLLRDYVANPAGPAYAPVAMAPFHGPMTFLQRTANFLFVALESFFTELVFYFVMEPTYAEAFPPSKYPSFAEAKKSVALVLTTSHFSQSAPIASFPSMVEVSGMHIPQKPKELPKNIQQWLDTAPHGVVYFSMGSNVKSTQITADKRNAIMRVFARLPQRVLWKWEDEKLPGKPDNVMVQKWLPQADVLAHKNVRLFITHCGKGSLNEARFHGVPILGVPIFADQPTNLKAVVDEGWAVPLLYSELTEQTFEAALKEALSNSSYGEVVGKAADLYKDRPMHPLDTAIYWVEYVLRHNGAKHMQSQAVHLNWAQYHSLDVLALLAAVAWLVWKLNVWFWRAVCSRLCRRQKSEKSGKSEKSKKA